MEKKDQPECYVMGLGFQSSVKYAIFLKLHVLDSLFLSSNIIFQNILSFICLWCTKINTSSKTLDYISFKMMLRKRYYTHTHTHKPIETSKDKNLSMLHPHCLSFYIRKYYAQFNSVSFPPLFSSRQFVELSLFAIFLSHYIEQIYTLFNL